MFYYERGAEIEVAVDTRIHRKNVQWQQNNGEIL
jgi:hypothetical protein